MATILEKANEILQEKNDMVVPENIKKGVTMFGVEGTVEEKPLVETNIMIHDGITIDVENVEQEMKVTGHTDREILLQENATVDLHPTFAEAAEKIGVTPDKLVKGQTILGVEGAVDLTNLLPENIKAGIEINGVMGTYTGEE